MRTEKDQADIIHSVPVMKLFTYSIQSVILNMSSHGKVNSIPSVLISKDLVSANHSTIVKYKKKLFAKEEEEIRKIQKEKF